MVQRLKTLLLTPECMALGNEYLKTTIMTRNDAFHVAIATIYGCDFLLSWDFTHLVNYGNRQKINAINISNGYKPIAIISPNEL